MAVRKVSNRGGNIIGHFPSITMGCMVDFESLIERDFIYVLDFEQSVEWFAAQPFTISYQHQGKMRQYTPDFHIIQNGQNIVVECKPEKFVQLAENQLKFAAANTWCSNKGWEFRIVTDVQLRDGYRLQNIKRLTQFARYNIKSKVKKRIRTFLSTSGPLVTIANIMVNIAPQTPQMMMIPVLHMAFHHELVLPLEKTPISVNSLVRLAPILGIGESL